MELLFYTFYYIFFIPATSQLNSSSPIFQMHDHSAHGVRFSGNDQFTIVAANNYERFVISDYPYALGPAISTVYQLPNLYIYSLAVLSDNNSISYPKSYTFVYVAENMKTQDVLFVYTIIYLTAHGMSKFVNKKWYSNS